MADTTNPVNTAQNPVQNQPKKQLFGGNQEVFDNLEKFEQLTNPTGEEDLDFAFEDLLDEADPAQSSLEESEYTFPEVNASESNPISANPGDEEFIIPEAEAQSVQSAENVFEAATQAPMPEPETVSQQKEEKSDLDYEVPLADEEENQVFEPLIEEELPEEPLPEHEEEVQLQPEFSPFATVKEAELEAPQQSMMDAPESSISAPEAQALQ